MWVRCACTVRGETNSRAATSLLPRPSLTSLTTSSSARVSDAQPLAGALAFAAAALRVGDRVFDGQRRALGPCRVEVVVAQSISNGSDAGLVVGFEDLEAHHAHVLAGRVRGTEQPRRHQVVVGFGRDSGKAVEGKGNEEVTLEPGRQVERVVGVAFGGVEFALRDLDARACRQGTAPGSNPWSRTRRHRPNDGPR